MKARTAAFLVLILPVACAGDVSQLPRISARESIQLTTGAFRPGGAIPSRFTCDGENIHPPLRWMGGPPAEEYTLIMVDQDADEFVHWIVYGIPGNITAIAETSPPPGASEGVNGFERVGYGGPCPPRTDAAHTYLFTVYSLRVARTGGLGPGASLQEVLDAIRCCIQAKGSLSATYAR
ncbi:MAG: YbhB/YbcL family Raf kinase inhibitor-like protein [Actinomycetota bacterium]|nr:YbhB/YbcL family Raf kinase inhibitor-like protein [Actinomycetota bacterium]